MPLGPTAACPAIRSALALLEGVAGVHAQAEDAAADLGGADPQQLDQERVEARGGVVSPTSEDRAMRVL